MSPSEPRNISSSVNNNRRIKTLESEEYNMGSPKVGPIERTYVSRSTLRNIKTSK